MKWKEISRKPGAKTLLRVRLAVLYKTFGPEQLRMQTVSCPSGDIVFSLHGTARRPSTSGVLKLGAECCGCSSIASSQYIE